MRSTSFLGLWLSFAVSGCSTLPHEVVKPVQNAVGAHSAGKLFEVEDPQGAARLVKYYYAGDRLLAREEGGERVWYHQDHLGSVRAMTDDQGVAQVAYEYAAFGDTIETTGAADNLRGFGAHWRDDESHLVYMGARYQDPVLGRFTQPDPMIPEPGDPQSWNRYSYVRNNSVNRIDPTGHADLDLGAAFGGALAQKFGVNRAFGRLAGSVLGGAVPGAGELADLGVLFSLDHEVGTFARLVATGSLVASAASLGTSPNVGSKVGIADEVAEAAGATTSSVVSRADEATAAVSGTSKSISDMAGEVAERAGGNRVSATTAGGKRVDFDLRGEGHFDKATDREIPTPRVHESRINVGPNGKVNLSDRTVREAMKEDVRTARGFWSTKTDDG